MYFPHNIDFRGRTYPIPPHLNHLGADICRGLLTFQEGRPLGRDGLLWIKVHLANVFGKDKLPFEKRVEFVEMELDNILDSAKNPLTGKRWWLQAESPWQTLATCIELSNILESKDPSSFISHLPVHQDGTCNGLQHYAALGGDVVGAKEVNLLPSNSPQDVYSGVSKLVAERIERDSKAGHEIAKLLIGKIERKIVKQTVMTSVYGVTFVGARQQISNAMKDKNILNHDDTLLYQASVYLARCTFDALSEMFLNARLLMDWLANCAYLIAKTGRPVKWITPLGLPVVQPYRSNGKQRQVIKTVVQSITLVTGGDLPINVNRQKSAFPPNFIHSLDSSHMLLTALECKKQGITYASVHDSYWTHAGSTNQMNIILREAFIDLHSRNLLPDLLSYFKEQNPQINFPVLPTRGELNLNSILNSKYFFN